MSFLAAAICFVVCHGGPADHFATFAQALSDENGSVKIFASGPALKKCEERGIDVIPFAVDGLSPHEEDVLAEQIASACSTASHVITDLGHGFAVKVQKALAMHAPHVTRYVYYDNPEVYVPGGYSSFAAEAMSIAERVLFANATLVEAPLFQEPGKEIALAAEKRIGIGYYPLDKAQDIAKQHAPEDVLVYFGGNNEEYFSKAFPAFLAILEEVPDLEILLHQHPGAKGKNIDGKMLAEWKEKHPTPRIELSSFSSSDEAQIHAKAILYYQTSMSAQFVLAGIPAIQIGHEPFNDILVRNGLCPAVTNADELICALNDLKQQDKEILFEALGIKTNWLENLKEKITGY